MPASPAPRSLTVKRLPPVALAVALLAGAASADTLVLRDGTSIDGVKVTAETWQRVEFKQPKVGTPQSRPAVEVREVVYASTSSDFREGQKAAAAGDAVTAAAYFDAAVADDKLPLFVRATARRLAADLWLAAGNLVDAGEAYDDLLETFENSRHRPAALAGKGQALLQSADFAGARKAFEALKAEARDKGFGERWEIEADYFGLVAVVAGKLKGADGQPVDAIAGFEAIRQRAEGKDVELVARCRVQIGRVHLGEGRDDAARTLFESILADRLDLPAEVVAGAYNGRGRTLFNQASARLDAADATAARGDKAKAAAQRDEALALFRDARLDFLRVFTQYGSVQGQQAEALFWAAQCFDNIGDTDASARSRVLLRLCETNYPNSPWGQRARQSQ